MKQKSVSLLRRHNIPGIFPVSLTQYLTVLFYRHKAKRTVDEAADSIVNMFSLLFDTISKMSVFSCFPIIKKYS